MLLVFSGEGEEFLNLFTEGLGGEERRVREDLVFRAGKTRTGIVAVGSVAL
jgi:hypothetical protein